jgi:hypothetical protein
MLFYRVGACIAIFSVIKQKGGDDFFRSFSGGADGARNRAPKEHMAEGRISSKITIAP